MKILNILYIYIYSKLLRYYNKVCLDDYKNETLDDNDDTLYDEITCWNSKSLSSLKFKKPNSYEILLGGKVYLIYTNQPNYSSDITLMDYQNKEIKTYHYKNNEYASEDNIYSIGDDFFCVYFRNVQNVECHGKNDHGQLNVPKEAIEYLRANSSLSKSPSIWLKSGPFSSCLHIKDRIYCWGLNGFNMWPKDQEYVESKGEVYEFGQDETICAYFSGYKLKCWGKCPGNLCSAIPKGTGNELSVGASHACYLDNSVGHYSKHDSFSFANNKKIGCWGNDAYGQTSFELEPVFESSIDHIVAADTFTCLYTFSGFVECYGLVPDRKPKQIANHASILSAGGNNTCAILGGILRCFGANNFGQLDLPTNKATIQKPEYKYTSINVKVGYEFVCAETSSNLTCWGLNDKGQTDFPGFYNVNYTPQSEAKFQIKKTKFTKYITSYEVGHSHSCAYKKGFNDFYGGFKSAICWGGHNQFAENDVPKKWKDNITQFALGNNFTCILGNPEVEFLNLVKSMICFGNNTFGQNVLPVLKKADRGANDVQIIVESISAGDNHICSVMNVCSKCWGSNQYGQTTLPKNKFYVLKAGTGRTCGFMEVDPSTSWVVCFGLHSDNFSQPELKPYSRDSLSLGSNHACIVDKAQGLVCWGEDEDGQCDVPKINAKLNAIPIMSSE